MFRHRADRPFGPSVALALCGVLALSACSAKYSQVPARLDLHSYGRVALVRFSVEQADTGMSVLATERFAEELLASQRVELLEVGSAEQAAGKFPAASCVSTRSFLPRQPQRRQGRVALQVARPPQPQ